MPRPSRRLARPPGSPTLREALLALACAGLALWVHRSALGVYFHPDDLISLEWARGVLPRPDFGPWRLLSGRAFFATALHLFGTDAFAYHLLNVLLHMTNVVLLFALARRWGATLAAATLAAGLFAAARPVFSVLQQAVGVGELLALGLAMAAMLLSERRSALATLTAVLFFLAAVLSKEGVLLLPLVLILPREPDSRPRPAAWRGRLSVAAPLLITSALGGAALAFARVRERGLGGEAYAIGFGTDLFHNLMTYTAWASDLWNPFFDEPGDISRQAWHLGLPVAAALIGLAWAARRRTRLPAVGLAWAGLAIAPVLPLLHHTFANYLYSPLAGLALALGGGIEAMVPGVRTRSSTGHPRRPAGVEARCRGLLVPGLVALLLLAHAAASERMLAARLTRRTHDFDLPLDRQLRKSEMVRRAVAGLQRSSPAAPWRMVLYMPRESGARLNQHTGVAQLDTTLGIEESLMYRVLDGGRALRALFPDLDSVAFVERWTADFVDFHLCANSPEGDIVDFGRGAGAHVRLGELLLRSGHVSLALDHLERACPAYPEDPALRAMLARARTALSPD